MVKKIFWRSSYKVFLKQWICASLASIIFRPHILVMFSAFKIHLKIYDKGGCFNSKYISFSVTHPKVWKQFRTILNGSVSSN